MRRLSGPLAVVLTAVPVRVWLASSTDLSPDEAYYLASARFGTVPDHPPLLVWMLSACDRMKWLGLELRTRLPAIVVSAAVALGIALLVHELEGRLAAPRRNPNFSALLAAILATWLPIPLAGGFVATPDAPAMLAVVAALHWASTDAPSPLRSALMACLVALGALSKVVVVPIAIVAAVIAPRRHRERLLWLLPLALTSPWITASLRLQSRHAFGAVGGWSAAGVITAAAATLVAALLLWCPPVVLAGVKRLRKLPAVYAAVFALVAALLLGSTLARALPPEPNWWTPAAIPVIVAGSMAIGALDARSRFACIALAVVPTAVALTHVVRPWLPIPRSIDPTARLHGWRAGAPPLDAPGVGRYAAAAELCIYRSECDDIRRYIDNLRSDISGDEPRWSKR